MDNNIKRMHKLAEEAGTSIKWYTLSVPFEETTASMLEQTAVSSKESVEDFLVDELIGYVMSQLVSAVRIILKDLTQKEELH